MPKGARGDPLARSVRRGVAALLTILLVAVLYHFIGRRTRPAPPAPGPPVPAGRAVDRKEGVRYREYEDGRVRVEARADRFFLGADGRDHLEGSVEVVDHSRADGHPVRITADGAAYDKGMVHFAISGRVRVSGGDLSFATEALDYDAEHRSYRAGRGGTFSSDRLKGSGAVFEYSDPTQELRVSGGFRLEVEAGPPDGGKAALAGNSLAYLRGSKKGRAEGAVRLISEDGEGSAAAADFELSADERSLRSAVFEGGGRFASGAGGRVVEARTVRLGCFHDSSRVARVEAEGGARLSLEPPAEPAGTIEAGMIGLALDAKGTLASWKASGGAKAELRKGPGTAYELAGDGLAYSAADRLLTVLPKEGAAACFESPDSRVEAPRIVLAGASDEVSASGGVSCLLIPKAGGTAVGFFPPGEAVFAACRALRSSGREKAYHLAGDARVWQGGRSVQAAELDVRGEGGEVRGRGGVLACFPGPAGRGGREAVIEAGGETMAYVPGERTVRFEGRSHVAIPGARLTADTVAVRLAGDANDVRDLAAAGAVVFVFGRYEGRGREAAYDPQAETLALTGDPVLAEQGRGESRGDKLTFRLADDKILVETKGQGRSITVVKS